MDTMNVALADQEVEAGIVTPPRGQREFWVGIAHLTVSSGGHIRKSTPCSSAAKARMALTQVTDARATIESAIEDYCVAYKEKPIGL